MHNLRLKTPRSLQFRFSLLGLNTRESHLNQLRKAGQLDEMPRVVTLQIRVFDTIYGPFDTKLMGQPMDFLYYYKANGLQTDESQQTCRQIRDLRSQLIDVCMSAEQADMEASIRAVLEGMPQDQPSTDLSHA